MFNKKDKLSQLKKLSAIKADDSWVHSTKYELLSEIDSQNRLREAMKLTRAEKLDMYFSKILKNIAPTFSRVIAGFLIIVMGSGFSMAAQASVPGQALWPVKRSIEKVELSLATNPVKETEIHMKHINKRLDEIEKILQDKNNSPEKVVAKEKAIEQAISHLERDIKSVDSSLKIVKIEKTASETVELAKKVKHKVREATDSLKKRAEESGDAKVAEAVEKVSESNEGIEQSAVNVALEVHEELLSVGSTEESAKKTDQENSEEPTESKSLALDPNKVDLEEVKVVEGIVKELIAEEIKELESEIRESKDYLLSRDRIVDGSGEIIEQTIDEEENESKTEDAEEKIGEAKTLLEGGSLKGAVEKITEGKEIQKKAEQALEKIKVEDEKENAEEISETEEAAKVEDVELLPTEESVVEASAIKEEAILEEEQN